MPLTSGLEADPTSDCPKRLSECFYKIRLSQGLEAYVKVWPFNQFSSLTIATIYGSPRFLQMKPTQPSERWKEDYDAFLEWSVGRGIGAGYSVEEVLNAAGEPLVKHTTVWNGTTAEVWNYANGLVVFRDGFAVSITSKKGTD